MLKIAIEAAKANPIIDLPRMAAVITRRSKVISIGLNKHKTHPMAKRFQKHSKAECLHAEIDAIRNAIKNGETLQNCSIYVARVLKNNQLALAMPCEGCKDAIDTYGISNTFWTKNQNDN